MAQQINLLNPDLRPRRDWLGFPMVAGATLAALALVAANGVWVRVEASRLAAAESAAAPRLKAAQDRLLAVTQAVKDRHADPALAKEAERLAQALQLRREALATLGGSGAGDTAGFSAIMAGLARQSMEGLWLTGFTAGAGELEIRGRMLDPALLPGYIRRLNGEPAFQGRRFAELEMKDVEPADPAKAAAATADKAAAPVLPRHTEFVLRSSPAPAKPGGGR